MSEQTTGADSQITLTIPWAVLGFIAATLWALLRKFEASDVIWVLCACWLGLSLIAMLAQIGPGGRSYLIGTLGKSTFTQIHTNTTRKGLNSLWNRYCDAPPEKPNLPATFHAALTWRLYDAALLIAVVYPILLLVGWWGLGYAGQLGSAVILQPALLWPDRAVTLGGIAVILLSVQGSKGLRLAADSRSRSRCGIF